MRFQLISLREASSTLDAPFQLVELMAVGEYACYLYRCEGEVPLHRHLEHDELFWPQDRSIDLVSEHERARVEPGYMARVPRGCRHGSAANGPAHVLLFSRVARAASLNGHYDSLSPEPPAVVSLAASLSAAPPNQPQPLLRCDTLQLYVERVVGTGASRHAEHDVLIAPLHGSAGLRCGGIMTIVQERELVRVPAGSGWHLFGQSSVLWMTPRPAPPTNEGEAEQ
jgi:uncharacterized cupin superfamily protein